MSRLQEEIFATTLSNFVNIVISDSEEWQDLELFGEEPVIVLPNDSDMYDVLVAGGFFKSKGDAKKNWQRTGRDIELGFNSWVIGRVPKALFVFKPANFQLSE